MAHLQGTVFVFDFEPPAADDSNSCVRCGYVPPSRTTGVLEIDLWPAPGIVADEQAIANHADRDGRLNLPEDTVQWVVMCGICLYTLRDAGAEYWCVPFWVETE